MNPEQLKYHHYSTDELIRKAEAEENWLALEITERLEKEEQSPD